MSPLFAPILAQVLSADVGDRIETRVVREAGDTRLEAENLAYVTVGMELEPLTLRAAYAPRILLQPLERSPREFSVTHTLIGSALVDQPLYESRRTTTTFHLEGNFSQEDLREELLGAPLPSSPERPDDPTVPPSTPDRTSEDLVQVTNTTTRAGTARAAISASQRVSKRNTLGQYGGYDVSSGLDETSRLLYPLTHGPDAGLTYIHLLTRRDTLTTSAQGDLSFVPEEDERQTSLGISQGIAHQFSRRTLGEAAAGVTYVRSVSPVEGVDGGVVPTGRLSLTYNALLARGRLVLTTEAGYGPVLDRTTLVFDTRFDAAWSATWTRDKWALYTTAGATLSVDVTQEGAFRRYMGTTGASYDIGSGFSAHVGGRSLWESYEGTEVVAPTWVGFVALSWSYELFRLQLAPPPRPKPPAAPAE